MVLRGQRRGARSLEQEAWTPGPLSRGLQGLPLDFTGIHLFTCYSLLQVP